MARRGSWGRSSEVSFEHGDSFTERGHQEERRRPASGPVCPGSCNARWRRVQEVLDAYQAQLEAWEAEPIGNPPPEPEVGEVRPWLGDPVLCPRCQSQLRMELAELSDLAAIADMENSGHRHGPDAERVSGNRHAPSSSVTGDELDELASVLRSWESLAKGEEESAARVGYLMSEISTTVARLGSLYFMRLVSNADVAAEFMGEMRQWHRHFKDKLTRTGTGRRQMRRPCPRCERYSLVEEDGAEYIACQTPTCQRMLSREEYKALDVAFGKARPGVA